jgi:hypothetical protein
MSLCDPFRVEARLHVFRGGVASTMNLMPFRNVISLMLAA